MCTLRNFPSLIDHCIEWARAQFTDMFVKPPSDALKFTEDQSGYLDGIRKKCLDSSLPRSTKSNNVSTELPTMEALKVLLEQSRNASFSTCVQMAVDMFNNMFRDRIKDLISEYPADAVNSEGQPFWTGAKRFPEPAIFDDSDEMHMTFVMSVANILAVNMGLAASPNSAADMIPKGHEWRDAKNISSILNADVVQKPWRKKSVVVEEPGNDEASVAESKVADESGKSADESLAERAGELEAILVELENSKPLDRPFQPADFEKDQDLNFHIDFITAAANLRARNYRIKEAPKHKCKLIAGKIIPAIATTTAAVTGLVMTEMYKVIQGKGMEAYRDSSNNLGINAYFFSEPAPADQAKDEYDPIMMEEVKCLPAGFTKWDKTEVAIDQGTTLKQFLEIFKKQTGLTCSLLLHSCAETAEEGSKIRGRMLYDSNAWQQKTKELFASKMETPLIDWIKERYAEAELFANPNLRLLPLIPVCADDSGQSFKIPQLVVKWR